MGKCDCYIVNNNPRISPALLAQDECAESDLKEDESDNALKNTMSAEMDDC